MYNIDFSGQFKKDYKLMKRRGYDMQLMEEAFLHLCATGTLPPEYQPHKLSGNMAGIWDAHITPDWLILYEVTDRVRLIRMARTGTHSDLFKK